MFEFKYSGGDPNYKLWYNAFTNAEVTLIDGIRMHPYLDPTVLLENYSH